MNKETMKSTITPSSESDLPISSEIPSPSPVLEGASTRTSGIRTSLRIKLPVTFILLISTALLITMLLSISLVRSSLISTLQDSLVEQNKVHAENTRSYLIWTRSFAIDLAANVEAHQYDETELLATIEGTLRRNSQIFGSTVAYEPYKFDPNLYYWSPYYSRSAKGELIFTQLGTPEYNYFQWDWYTLPKLQNAAVLSPPYFDKGGGNIWMVTWSVPFYNKSNEFQGVATADIAFSQTQDLIRQIRVGEEGYAFMIDNKGVILGIGDKGGTYNAMIDSILNSASTQQAVAWNNMIESMINGRTGFAQVVDPQGRSMFVSYAPIGMGTSWSLALAYPQDELFLPVTKLTQTLIILTISTLLVFSFIIFVYSRSITLPIQKLANQSLLFAQEHTPEIRKQLLQPVAIETNDELEELGTAYNQMTSELVRTLEMLEEKVNERTLELRKVYSINERRAKQFEAITQVSRVINQTQGLQDLLPQITQVISQQFSFYHVGIFLVDSNREYAVLVAANSEGGERMLARNHKLKIGQTGIVGAVAGNGIPRIALDTGADAIFFNNPDLPETRSEMALPLVQSQREIIGVLDVQSTEPNAFSQDDIQILSTLAEQVTIAIANARLYEKTQKSIIEAEMYYRRDLRASWRKFTRSQKIAGIRRSNLKSMLLTEPAAVTGETEVTLTGNMYQKNQKGASAEITLPIRLRGEVVGVLNAKNEQGREWSADEIDIVTAILERAALAIDNARLLAESQKAAEKERLIGEIATKVSSFTNRENILQTAVAEIGRVLPGAEVVIQIQKNENNG